MFKKLWRRFFSAKRPFKLTKAGWVFILYTIGVGAGAINTGNNLLYLVFGVFLGMILASGLLSDLSLWGLSVEWTFPHSSEAGQPAAVFLRITNRKKWLPSISVTIGIEGELKGKTVPVRVYVPYIAAGQTASARVEFVPAERGWFEVIAARLYTRYPFALLEKWWTVHRRDTEELKPEIGDREHGFFVTPSMLEILPADLPNVSRNETPDAENLQRGDGTTFFGVRPFRYGDNPRRIHWKSSAKAPGLLVREMEIEAACDVALRCPSALELKDWKEQDIENLVSFMASVVRAYEDTGHRTHVLVADGEASAIDEFLSLWDPKQELNDQIRRWVAPFDASMLTEVVQELDALQVFQSWQGRKR